MNWKIENGRLKDSRGFTLADMRYVGATPQVKAVICAAPELLQVLKAIMLDLPEKRDWLDPMTEKFAKETIANAEKNGL